MNATQFLWMNGKVIPWAEAKVHVMSHALNYGTSVFEGIRCYETAAGPAFFRLQEHLRRLLDSARVYYLPVPYTRAELSEGCHEVIRKNGLRSGYLRPLVFLGAGTVSVCPKADVPVETCIAAFEMGAYLGRGALEEGIDACVSSWHRTTSSSNPVLAKAGGHYTNAYLIGAEARRNGFAEGISVNSQGLVCEGAAANVFMVRDGVLYTPPISASILGGITRDSVVRLARDLGMTVEQQNLPREMLYIADEMFMTGTAAEITPVRSLDRIPIGKGKPGPLTLALQKAFFGLFNGATPDRHGWLEAVSGGASAPDQAVAAARG